MNRAGELISAWAEAFREQLGRVAGVAPEIAAASGPVCTGDTAECWLQDLGGGDVQICAETAVWEQLRLLAGGADACRELLAGCGAASARLLGTPCGDVRRGSQTVSGQAEIFTLTVNLAGTDSLALSIAFSTRNSEAAAPDAGRLATLARLLDVEMTLRVRIACTRIRLRDVLDLTIGSMLNLEKAPNEPVELIVNECTLAQGEVVVVGGTYAIRVQQMIGARRDTEL